MTGLPEGWFRASNGVILSPTVEAIPAEESYDDWLEAWTSRVYEAIPADRRNPEAFEQWMAAEARTPGSRTAP